MDMSNLSVLLIMLCIYVILGSKDKPDLFGISEIQKAQSRRKKPASAILFNPNGKHHTADQSNSTTRIKKVHDELKAKEPSSKVEASNTSEKVKTDEVTDISKEMKDIGEKPEDSNFLNTK
jgi:hypothetical protein